MIRSSVICAEGQITNRRSKMNANIKTLSMVTAVLAGAIIASGQPQERRQRR
jgi:hypothetical protein